MTEIGDKVKRSLRGLYVIRGGAPAASVSERSKQEEKQGTEAPDDGRLATLEVNFSRFNTWYRIDSFWEGTFLERTVPGSFKKTIAERGSQVKILFNHGMDAVTGDRVLALPEVIEERKDSPYLEGPLFDTSYNRDLLPGLRAGAYGSSFMFEVLGETWNREPDASDYNPEGLPERTITEVRLHEAGPVTWPANPDATAGIRSGVDWYAQQVQQRDQGRYTDLVRTFEAFRALNGLGTPAGAATQQTPEPVPPAPEQGRHVAGVTAAARRRRLTLIDMAGATGDYRGTARTA